MPFKGAVKRNVLVQFIVTSAGGTTATTLQKVVRIPQLSNTAILEVDVLTTTDGQTNALTPTFGNNVIRALLAVSPQTGAAAELTVCYGGACGIPPEVIAGDTTFVYDVVP